MPELQFMSVGEAFNRIGATKENGLPYGAVRGVSVSKQGRQFRFWEEDVFSHDDRTMELYRPPQSPQRRWRFTDQGRAFYAALVEAKESGASVFVVLNKRGKNDQNNKSVATAAAPVLTSGGKPAPGRVLVANAESGEARVVISLSGQVVDATALRFIDQFDMVESPVSKRQHSSTSFSRDPAVRSRVLLRAGGICERPCCRTPGFQTPAGIYLETHHVISLSDEGRDATDNVVAICANCHRMAHHSIDRKAIRDELLQWLRPARHAARS